ncbi:CPCC family cysteine-rich protein [Streptomyces sp. NPDC007917]|uniref:CPCC family cysteine-rich protein n=1 Tax=Streptomyces sp. NPDC007917 TaxID=3364793 RepID=UPI0036E50C00
MSAASPCPCPCRGHRVLEAMPGSYEIRPVCWWSPRPGAGTTHDHAHRETRPAARRRDRPVVRRPRGTDRHGRRRPPRPHRRAALPRRPTAFAGP